MISLEFAQRLARDERRARDRAGELLDRVTALGLADEDRACRLGRPELPLHVLRRDRLAELDVDLGDQDLDGVDRGGDDGLRRRRLFATAAGEQRGSAAGGDRDHEDNKTRGFHTLHFPQ